MPQGTDDSSRIGDKIEPVSLHLKLQMDVPFASTAGHMVRVVIYSWEVDSTAEAPTANALFINDATSGTRMFRSYWNVDRSPSYRVVFDQTFDFASVYNVDSSNIYFEREISLARIKKRIKYTAASTGGTGKLFLSASWQTITNPVNVVAQAMFRYRDM